MTTTTSNARPATQARKRKAALLTITGVAAAGLLAWGLYWGLHGRYYVSTDNAYVAGNVVQVTPQVPGTVVGIQVEDTDFVKAGQPLVRLDPADARVALEQAQAQLAQTVREVRTLFVNDATYAANVRLREADLRRAGTEVARWQDDLARRQGLTAKGAVSKEELDHVQAALANAQASAEAALAAAREQLAANRALIDRTTVETHPNVQRAAARLREAHLAYTRASLPAPVSGYIAKRAAQVGQRVAAGTPLMSIVPLDQVWIDANFKEVQLADMRIGQPVKVQADIYGSKVEYDGRVVGVGAGTGSAFALLPAQNATGNWIKVVQRVPVRVVLDARQLAEHPLRVGMSAEVTVDVHDRSGKVLADVPRSTPVARTEVFATTDAEADRLVRDIIARNAGGAATTARGQDRAAAGTPAAPGVAAAAGQHLAHAGAQAVAARH